MLKGQGGGRAFFWHGISSGQGNSCPTPAWEPGHVSPWARERPRDTSITGKLGTAKSTWRRAPKGGASAPFEKLPNPNSHKSWEKKRWTKSRAQGKDSPQKGWSEVAKPMHSVPFPAHGQPSPSLQGSVGFAPGFTVFFPKKGPTAQLLLPPSPPKQTIASAPAKSSQPFKAEPQSSPAKPPARLFSVRGVFMGLS